MNINITKILIFNMSIVILTPEIRELSYFSSFSLDEKNVVIPRPFINESINYKEVYNNVEDIPENDLLTIIENLIYLNFERSDNDELIKELLWRLGETKEKMDSIKNLSTVIQTELNEYLKHEESEYIYGIRCRVLEDCLDILNTKACNIAAVHGNLKLLKWIRSKGYYWNHITFYCAIENGHLHIVKYLHENGCEWNKRVCKTAARYKNFEILKYLHENNCPWDEDTFNEAVKHEDINIVKYLYENKCQWDKDTCSTAAEYGRFEILKYLHNNGCSWNEWTFNNAARHGNIDILEYLYQNSCPYYDSVVYRYAFFRGNFQVVKWLHKKGINWNEYVCSLAAYEGCLDILKYLRENGCPWDESSCREAAYNDNLETLKYLHENGCPWDWQTCEMAACNGHLDTLKYAIENGCPCPDIVHKEARSYNHPKVLEYLDSL